MSVYPITVTSHRVHLRTKLHLSAAEQSFPIPRNGNNNGIDCGLNEETSPDKQDDYHQ